MPKTYNELYISTRAALKRAGVEAYSLEARLLVSHAVGKSKEAFLRDLRLYTSTENEQKINALLQRRLAGEPLAYLIGEWEFYGLPIKVTPDVLIPRMDTEVLVETAVNALVGRKMDARILDLCSGSGCIGCAISHELPAARLVMVDISDRALEVSKQNLRLNRQNRTICLKADALAKPPMSIGTFDLIVSNPPYVPSFEILTLDSSVRDYEPLGALDGGEDGLMFYRAIVRNWKGVLRPGGQLMFEVGETQADAVSDLMRGAGFRDIATVEDTAGVRRVVTGRI
ncbi:MAG: peptide chain release factor N(5)-glutamine methyltransferase [Oscillospiraceae bacterium]|nr:peptide chain release factor N(5)-glutamine methyltransferase [Clostridiales bacterium]MDY2961277.1 peptide chain release factor N(5)-glutamine methyltransferase [Oscillospiraceae bacterium]MDD6077078.1 peptide chain release factor N(5)-glutamine methyltransferase [Clostridiales bacterium]MDD6108193.1 peptide chain release factor N(5)-glutamine methyltransferase [Clostridiales bacterium]MDY5594091.1 peptide chain release factor N(5)-glutamine methyltransferase [Oscillospiraceae bacterium]